MEFGLVLILFVGLIVLSVFFLFTSQHFKTVRNQRKETLK